MSRVITCVECGKHLGEIRDAKLRKNISFICDGCETGRLAMKMKMNTSGFGNNDFCGDVFKDTFGEIFGGSKYNK